MPVQQSTSPFVSPVIASTLRRALPVVLACALGAGAALAQPDAAAPPFATAGDEIAAEAQSAPKKHRKRQGRPVQMGTSGGNINDVGSSGTRFFCCSGTLGGLLSKKGEVFVLSNNHVLAITNLGQAGDAVNQPGMLDNNCRTPESDFVAELSDFKRISFGSRKNKVDAAIARVLPDQVDLSGSVIGLGVPGNDFVKARLGMEVVKSGRTTGVTAGIVNSVNASVVVTYTDGCSPDANELSARFKKQILIRSRGVKDFSAGGDSGSIIYEDVKSCPRAVGLLFAGGVGITVANPMKQVLRQVKTMKPKGKAELIGCDSAESAAPLKSFAASAARIGIGERELRIAERIQARAEDGLLAIRGVHGVAIGRSSTDAGASVLQVYVDDATLAAELPRSLDGLAVEAIVGGPFRALTCREPAPGS